MPSTHSGGCRESPRVSAPGFRTPAPHRTTRHAAAHGPAGGPGTDPQAAHQWTLRSPPPVHRRHAQSEQLSLQVILALAYHAEETIERRRTLDVVPGARFRHAQQRGDAEVELLRHRLSERPARQRLRRVPTRKRRVRHRIVEDHAQGTTAQDREQQRSREETGHNATMHAASIAQTIDIVIIAHEIAEEYCARRTRRGIAHGEHGGHGGVWRTEDTESTCARRPQSPSGGSLPPPEPPATPGSSWLLLDRTRSESFLELCSCTS